MYPVEINLTLIPYEVIITVLYADGKRGPGEISHKNRDTQPVAAGLEISCVFQCTL